MYGRNGKDGMRGHRDANGKPARGDADEVKRTVGMAGAATRRHAALLLGVLFAAGGCSEGANGAEGGRGDPTARLLPNVPAEDRVFLFSWAGTGRKLRSTTAGRSLNWVRCRPYYRPGAERRGTRMERACLRELPVMVAGNLRRLGYEIRPRDAVNWRIFLWMDRETDRFISMSSDESAARGLRQDAWKKRHGLGRHD